MYLDAALPFGLRSAPLIFIVVTDALQRIMDKRRVTYAYYYIDNFVTAGPLKSPECGKNSHIMHETCRDVGLPVEHEKDEGPTTCLPFTDIELDNVAMELRLPQEKLSCLRSELSRWRGRKACRKRELLSLIGSLSHACKVIRPGHPFLRRLIDLSTTVNQLDRHVQLSREARWDIEWWREMEWIRGKKQAVPNEAITPDASGRWGCGAFHGSQWFMLPWVGSGADCAKELPQSR